MGYLRTEDSRNTHDCMKLAIVIVNWNTGELLGHCLRSLKVLPPRELALIDRAWVIDNASSDNSIAMSRVATSPQAARGEGTLPIEFIINKTNVGFARANNQALDRVSLDSHVLLLNPDTEVRPGALTALLRVLDERVDVGIVGPHLVNPDNSTQGSIRPFPRFSDFVLYMLKMGRIIQSRQEGSYDYTRAQYVDQVMGAAFLIRDSTLRKVGMLDESFIILFEEVDYALRARHAGWRSYYTPAATIMHVRAASFSQLIGWRKSWPWLKSSLRYARKHLPAWQAVIVHMLLPISLLLIIPATLKHVAVKYAH